MSIVRRADERPYSEKQLFGGEGVAEMHPILNGAEEMYGKGRLFNHVFLKKGCEIGWHIHHGDGECYYILSGRGEYSDNGNIVTLGPGDMSFVGAGEGHSLKNNGDEPLELIALVLYV